MRIYQESHKPTIHFCAETKEERSALIEMSRHIVQCFHEDMSNQIRSIRLSYSIGGTVDLAVNVPPMEREDE